MLKKKILYLIRANWYFYLMFSGIPFLFVGAAVNSYEIATTGLMITLPLFVIFVYFAFVSLGWINPLESRQNRIYVNN